MEDRSGRNQIPAFLESMTNEELCNGHGMNREIARPACEPRHVGDRSLTSLVL